MSVGARVQPAKMLLTYFSTALGLTRRASVMPLLSGLGHQLEDLQLAGVRMVQRVGAAADLQQLGDHLRVEGGAAGGHLAQGVEEVAGCATRGP